LEESFAILEVRAVSEHPRRFRPNIPAHPIL
jgi:hypothetical protein